MDKGYYLEVVVAPLVLLPPAHVSSCFLNKSIGTWEWQFTHVTFGLMEIFKKGLINYFRHYQSMATFKYSRLLMGII